MATAGPSKRSRREDDVDGDEEVEIESAMSSFRQGTNKRTKIAIASAAGAEASDDDDTEDDGYANGFLEGNDSFVNDANGDVQDDTEIDDPDNEDIMYHIHDDSDEEEVNELMATQIVNQEMRRKRSNIVQEEGIIEEIFCRNFMCHSKLRICPGPNINFIIGHNGSGKSAVLTALVMCLGGKAAQTNRGASLKTLIKEGQDSATLGVKIKNQGENSYKSEQFGRSITVERNFSRSGGSSFKLKSENDKTVSTKRADLDDILDYFGLQLDNPINVLTQDMARQFLSNSTPADKYKFFLRGTMLEALDADYKVMEENLDGYDDKLAIRKADLAILKLKHEEAEQKKQAAQHLQRINQRVGRIRRMHAWCQVEAQESLCQRYEEDVTRAQDEVRQKEEFAETIDARFEAAEAKVEASERVIGQFQEQLGPAKEKWTAARAELDANKKKLTDFKDDERQMKTSRKSAIDAISRLEREVDAEEDRLAGHGGEAHVRRQGELQELQAAAAEVQEEREQHDSRKGELDRGQKAAQDHLNRTETSATEARTAIQAAEGNLSQLQRDERNKYAPYMPNMEQLCREIDRETRWRSKPVGPFGMHIQLKKPEWSSVIETVMGGVLNAFAVTNKDDAELFNALAKRVRCNAAIYIGSSQALDTTGKEPNTEVDTILRILTFKSDIVRNQLIINQSIDQSALVTDNREAQKFMFESAGGRPDNVRVTLSLESGDQRVAGHRWQYTRSGAQKSDAIFHWPRAPRMQTDRGQQLDIARARVTHAKREQDEAQKTRNQARDRLTKADQALQAHSRESKRLKVEVQRAEVAIEEKQAEIDNNRPQDGKLQELQRQLDDAKKEKQAHENELSDLYEQKAVYDEKGPTLLTTANEAKQEMELIEQRIEHAQTKATKASADRHELLLEKNDVHAQVGVAKADVERLQRKVDQQKDTVAEYIREASKISERVAVDEAETPASLDHKLESLKAQYARERAQLGASEEELTREWERTHREWTEAQKQWNEMRKDATLLKHALKERHYRWRRFREYISARARIQFGYLLSERQFRGRVLLDHEGKKLDIKVEPDMAKSSDAGREARTLSGGEKSFSTICLLLSIWEAMGSPIRCLDEFDVFMDSVNRSQSMNLMIQAARRSAGRQFILITPQAMNNVDLGDDVKIHKMSDPERGQTNLAFNGREL